MTVPNWRTEGDWDTLRLGNEVMPGVANVQVEFPSGLDIKKPKGARGATIKDQGAPPAELRITLELQHEDMERFESVLRVLRPRAVAGARNPLEITHPQAALWGIAAVTVGPISSPMPQQGGTYIVAFTAYEWAPAPKKVKKSSAAAGTPEGPGKTVRKIIEEETGASSEEIVNQNFSSADQQSTFADAFL